MRKKRRQQRKDDDAEYRGGKKGWESFSDDGIMIIHGRFYLFEGGKERNKEEEE